MADHQETDGVFLPTIEDQDCDENRLTGLRAMIQNDMNPLISDQMSLGTTSPPFTSFSIEEMVHEDEARYSNYIPSTDLSRFGSLPLQQVIPCQIPCSEEIVLCGLSKGQSSGIKRKHDSLSLQMQTDEQIHEDEVEEEQEMGRDCKQPKKKRSSEVHNLNERLRRQKLQDKMRALREMIPNCDKREKAHVLDEAMKYIKTLQSQLQMMSMGAGLSMFHSIIPQLPGHIPSTATTLSQFPLTNPTSTGIGIGMGMGMGISGVNYPMGFLPTTPCPLTSATSRIPSKSLSESPHSNSIQNNNDQVFEPLLNLPTSSPIFAPWTFPSPGSQGTTTSPPRANGKDFCTNPLIGERSCMKRGATARVLPSRIILPHHVVQGVENYGSSHSGSSEWGTSSSVAKSEGFS